METKLGTYTYKHPTYTGGVRTYVEYQMRVQIVDERANKWKVKYLGQHASGAAIGTLHNVRKDKVRLDVPGAINGISVHSLAPQDRPQINIRLPYKDNDYDD